MAPDLKMENNTGTVKQNRPGGPLSPMHLWDQKVVMDPMRILEFTTPDRELFQMPPGEELVFVREPGSTAREPHVRQSDGELISFAEWREGQLPQVIRNNHFKLNSVSPELGELYALATAAEPSVEKLLIHLDNAETQPVLKSTGGFHYIPEKQGELGSITISTDGAEHYRHLLKTRAKAVNAFIDLTGIRRDALEKNPELLRCFIVLHEIGHAVDYKRNYLDTSKGNVDEANRKWYDTRKTELLSLPVPGYNPVDVIRMHECGKLETYFRTNSAYYASRGVRTVDDLIAKHDKAYHEIGTEQFADNFAAGLLKQFIARASKTA